MNIPSGLSQEQTRNFLQRQVNTGRYMILGTAVITLVNIVLLLCNANFYITYSSAAAYYLVWLGKGFDNGFMGIWYQNGTYTITGLVLALVILAGITLVWWLSRKNELFYKIGMGLIAADVVVLFLVAALMQWPFGEYLLELALHIAVLYEMFQGLSAGKQLKKLAQQEAAAQEELQEAPI